MTRDNIRSLTENSDEESTNYITDVILNYLTPVQIECALDYELRRVCRNIDILAIKTGTRITCGHVRGNNPEAVAQMRDLVAHRATLQHTLTKMRTQNQN